jgi:hypothetical protein
MKCEEYKEAISGDPSGSFDGGPDHVAGCEACGRYRDSVRALDVRIAAALAIAVPSLDMPELPPVDATDSASADSSRVVELPRRRAGRASLPSWLGIAAGVAIAAFVGFNLLAPELSGPSLAEQVLAHMEHEQDSRTVTSIAVSEQQLGDVIDPEVATPGSSGMNSDLGLVTYAQSCVINGHTVPHLVVQGRDGPITLILLSEETIDQAIPLSGDSVHGVIVPVGKGSVAIIGQRPGQMGEIGELQDRIVTSVKWRI